MSAAAAFAVPMAVSAAPISLDGYYVNSTFDPEGAGSDDGDGLGVRLMVPFQGSGIRIHGEYQTAELDDSNVDLDQLRLGASFMTEGNARFGAVAEYVNITLDGGGGEFEPDGYGIHGRGEFSMSEQFQFYGQIGYVDTSDSGTDLSGIEYLIGGVFNITPMWGIGVDYRYSDLELEDGGEADVSLEDIRIGVRVNFGT
ncbi:MAG TPA: outer membrane beta-barrel protein [Nevskiaceae bacterium]|nr:outer membrane beta-barrel protein [Nevskiaceae bacterium]